MFCSGLLVWHIFAPNNPDHYLNIVSHSSMAILFFASSRMSVALCRVIHTVTLFIGATMTVCFGNFPVAAIIFFLATLLYYAYGGFRSISSIQSIVSFSVVFIAFFFGITISGYGVGPSYGLAVVWTTGVFVIFYILWLVLQHLYPGIITQNRDLLEFVKKLKKGECSDVATKRG